MRIDTGIEKRGKSFRFTVCCGYRADGTQIRKYRTWIPPENKTERQQVKLAKLAYSSFRRECTNAYDLHDSMRFGELVDWYAENYAQNLKAQTWSSYQQKIHAYLLPEFKNRRLKDFSPVLLTEFYRNIAGKRKDQLSYQTLRSINKVMNSLFTCAVRQGLLEQNPCKNAIIPKPNVDNSEPKRYYMTPEETQLFLNLTAVPTQDNAIFRLLLYTGMRVGECLALCWSDIDFTSGFIHIRKNLVYANHETFLSSTKTKSSVRTIAISPAAKAILLEQKKRHMEMVHVLGSRIQHPEMVFVSPTTGSYVIRNALSSRFRKLMDGTAIDFMTLHMLRHSNASLLLNAGVDIKIVSEHLGHNEIGTTADIYADIFASTKTATANLIDQALHPQAESNKLQINSNSKIIPFKPAK